MKGFFIINPNSGMRTVQKNAFTAAKKLMDDGTLDEARFFCTRGGGDAEKAAAALKPGEYDFVMSVGGDGTVNEVVNGLVRADCRIPLAILGAGTTNDFVDALGLGTTSLAMERLLRDFCVRESDVGVANGRYFMNVVSGGTIPAIAHNVTPEQKSALGPLAYYIEGVKEIGPSLSTSRMLHFEGDNVSVDEDAYLFAVANSSQSGGFPKLAPTARLNDGLMDVCIIKRPLPLDLLPVFGAIQMGTHVKDDQHFTYFQTKKLTVTSLDPSESLEVDYDGERAGSLPLTIEMGTASIPLLVPANSSKAYKLFNE